MPRVPFQFVEVMPSSAARPLSRSRWLMIVAALSVSCAAALVRPATAAGPCDSVADAYARAQCVLGEMQAAGSVSPGNLAPNMMQTPQYGGSAGCTNSGCSGAPQEGYFSNTGDIGPLNSDSANATLTDPTYSTLQDQKSSKDGWDVSTTAPVKTAEAVASSITPSPGLSGTCVDVPSCVEWVPGPPSIQTCQVPGIAETMCYRTWSPSLTAAACSAPPNGTPPVDTETLFDGCSPYQALAASGQATQKSVTCLDDATRTLTCSEPTGAAIGTGGSWGGLHDHGPGMSQAWYGINYVIPTPNGAGGYTLKFSFSGNAAGENKYGCTNANGSAGSVLVAEGGSASMVGRPPFCNRKCACWGNGMTFVLGTATWTAPTTFQIPFTFWWEAHAYTVTITGGLTWQSYNVSPQSGCWNEQQTWQIQTQASDTCQSYVAAGCTQIASSCSQFNTATGTCEMYANTYSCASTPVCDKTVTMKQCNQCGTPGSYVPFCVNTSTPPDQSLAMSATYLQLIKDVENDWDTSSLRVFNGTRMACDYSTIASVLINCCDASDPSKLLGTCSDEEIQLAKDRQLYKAHYVGDRCVEWISFGLGKVCTRKEQVYCDFKSELARIVQEQGRGQIGWPWGSADAPDCSGFSITQFSSLNFAAMDFTEWYVHVNANIDPAAVASDMNAKICAYSGKC